MIKISHDHPSHIENIGPFSIYVLSSDVAYPPREDFNFIEIISGDHIVPLIGSPTILNRVNANLFVATPETDFAWIDGFDVAEGDRLNVYALGFTTEEEVLARAHSWMVDAPYTGTVVLQLAENTEIRLGGMTLEQFAMNARGILDFTPLDLS
jgi:hypothetical protein